MSRFALALIITLCASVTLGFSAPVLASTTSGYYGKGTYFETGLGACGNRNKNSDHIVALPSSQYNGGSHCGEFVEVENTSNGKTITAMIQDECPTCAYGSLDMSPSAFSAIGPKSEGVLPIKWYFM